MGFRPIIASVVRDDDGEELQRTEKQAVFIVEAKSESESVPEIDGTIQVDANYPDQPDLTTSYWYTQSDSQLIEIAYRNPGPLVMLKNRRSGFMMNPFMIFGELEKKDAPSNEITVRLFPRTVLEFPLMAGKSWVSLVDSQNNPAGTMILETTLVLIDVKN